MMAKKELEGYKIVCKCREGMKDVFFSALRCSGPERALYNIECWTERVDGNGPFAVFGTLITARIFLTTVVSKNPNVVFCVFRCLYKKSRAKSLWFRSSGRTGAFTYKPRLIRNCGIRKLPNGTVLADAVKIIEEVGIYGHRKTSS